jgi:hypothetical protein
VACRAAGCWPGRRACRRCGPGGVEDATALEFAGGFDAGLDSGAGAHFDGIAVVAARAGVHGGDELEVGGEGEAAVGQGDLAGARDIAADQAGMADGMVRGAEVTLLEEGVPAQRMFLRNTPEAAGHATALFAYRAKSSRAPVAGSYWQPGELLARHALCVPACAFQALVR